MNGCVPMNCLDEEFALFKRQAHFDNASFLESRSKELLVSEFEGNTGKKRKTFRRGNYSIIRSPLEYS